MPLTLGPIVKYFRSVVVLSFPLKIVCGLCQEMWKFNEELSIASGAKWERCCKRVNETVFYSMIQHFITKRLEKLLTSTFIQNASCISFIYIYGYMYMACAGRHNQQTTLLEIKQTRRKSLSSESSLVNRSLTMCNMYIFKPLTTNISRTTFLPHHTFFISNLL